MMFSLTSEHGEVHLPGPVAHFHFKSIRHARDAYIPNPIKKNKIKFAKIAEQKIKVTE